MIQTGWGVTIFSFGLGGWVLAQTLTDQPWERLVGGGILVTVGVLSLRLVLRASSAAQAISAGVVAQLQQRNADLAEDLLNCEREKDAWRIRYDREWELRSSLEAAGISERRRTLPPEEEGLPHDR